MAVRVTLSLDDDVAAEIQKMADRSGRSLDETLNDFLRISVGPRRLDAPPTAPAKAFEVRAKALNARPGFDFDDIEGLLEQAEGPAHR
jgi:hypothetical protein